MNYIGNKEKLRRANQKIVHLKKELETSQKETKGMYDDYQDLGKEYYKLQCELEKAEKVIEDIKFINDTNKPHKAQAKTKHCIKEYFYKNAKEMEE